MFTGLVPFICLEKQIRSYMGSFYIFNNKLINEEIVMLGIGIYLQNAQNIFDEKCQLVPTFFMSSKTTKENLTKVS